MIETHFRDNRKWNRQDILLLYEMIKERSRKRLNLLPDLLKWYFYVQWTQSPKYAMEECDIFRQKERMRDGVENSKISIYICR